MFQVHSFKTHRPLSCPLASYREALAWARWFNDLPEGVEPLALVIVQHA